MALITCPECSNQVSTTAKACPQCGGVMSAKRIISTVSSVAPKSDHRKVSAPLIAGIVLLPYIFSWFLLRKGYSQTARIIGLGWLGIVLVGVGMSPHGQLPGGVVGSNAGGNQTGHVDVDPDRLNKFNAVALAKQAVTASLKDPSSADFGDVWGLSATRACGWVNAKNSFGAMAGKTRFIMDDGRVSFENEPGAFARRWNAICIDHPHVAPPSGAGGFRWGGRPTGNLKPYDGAIGNGLTMYVPKGKPEPLEGVAVAESDYTFDHGRFFGADFYIDGDAGRDAILAAYVKKYGPPQAYNEDAGSYSWKWPGSHIGVNINYDASHGRTTVAFNHE